MAAPENYSKLATIGIAYKGEYDEGTEYKYLNGVYYKGSTYVALIDNPTKPPTNDGANWKYLAEGFDGDAIIPMSQKGEANGVATLGNDTKIPKAQLPTLTSSDVGLGNVPNVTTNNQKPTFSQAATRANIASGETLTTILGKLMKWYADLKNVAFSGNYNDLSGKPTIPTVPDSLKNPQALTFTGGVSLTYDGSVARSVAIPTTLPANGGTADKLSTARTLKVNLASTGNATFDGSANQTGIGVAEVLQKANGGTGNVTGDASTVGGKSAAALQDYNNLSNKPLTIQGSTYRPAHQILSADNFTFYSTSIPKTAPGHASGYLYDNCGIDNNLTYQQVFEKLPNMSFTVIDSENGDHTYTRSLPCPGKYVEAIYIKSYARGVISLHSIENNEFYYTSYAANTFKGWKKISGATTISTFSAIPSTDQLWVDENGQFIRKYVDGAWQDIVTTNNEEENL